MTDYSAYIDSFKGIACIVSLRKNGESLSDRVTIAAANRKYLASVNKLDEEFVPNRPYTYYIAHDPNFEALTAGCVSEHKISHQYVNAELYNAWLDFYMIPLEDDEEGNGYCLFTYEMSANPDSEKMVGISAKTAYMVLKTCIKLRETDDFREALNSIVKDIRLQCESDGCAIILTDTEQRKIDVLSVDSTDDFVLSDDDIFLKPEFYNIVESWRDCMSGSNCIIITGEEDLKNIEAMAPEWYRSLVFSGIKSLVLYPLRVGRNLYGYVFASNFNTDKILFIREIMELNAFILSAEAENFRMHAKLEHMGRTDLLTGVLNRNAMSKRIAELASTASELKNGFGAIYVDVNGLKRVNDSQGHDHGDEMIISVADKIRTVFDTDSIFRVGGDEFLVISADIGEKEFYSRFERLKEVSRIAGEPSFALGADFSDSDIGIERILHTADQNMYKNKAEYYSNTPGADRRRR